MIDHTYLSVLVLGGTGFLGRAFCRQWVAHHGGGGPRLAVATRQPMRARDGQLLPTLDVYPCDVHDDAALARLLEGRDAVVNLVGILHGSAANFERVHAELPRRLARACGAAGVKRVVHVSALGAASDAPSMYLRSKAAGEAAWRESGLDVTLLRPSVMFGAEDRLLNLFADLQRWLPVLPLAGADSRHQPVWVEDVARAIVRCLGEPHTVGHCFDAVGPRVVTLAELARLAGRCAGHERRIIALPAPLARLQAALMERLPNPLLSRDNLDSMRVPSVADGGWSTLAALGIDVAPLESVVPSYLPRARGAEQRLDPWRARARRGG